MAFVVFGIAASFTTALNHVGLSATPTIHFEAIVAAAAAGHIITTLATAPSTVCGLARARLATAG